MKRYCKNIQLDKDWIMACMLECFSDKWKRRDVAGFLAGYQTGQPLSVRAVSRLIKEKRSNVDPLLERAAEDLAREIKERDVHFPEIHYSMRYDGNSGKLREIGVESIKQQIYNYVAVNALKELFERKIGKYQCASVPGRGQVYGKNAIERWIRKNPDKTRAGAKADVRHCYPSINTRKLMRFLRKQVKNDDLLYLVETLIASYKQGVSIGSYLSQWLCNYYLSFAYHYAQQKLFKVQKRRGQEKRARRAYLRLRKQVQRRMEIALDLAYRCISYYGWFKNSDSNHFKKKYGIEQLMKYAKRRVSIESKIHNRTAGGQLAAA